MVEIHVRYRGDLRCSAEHGPSGARLDTDAPVDNQGLGQSFSPTDLVATGLGSCMLTLMGITARQRGWPIEGLGVRVEKQMTKRPPRRIERLTVEFDVPETVRAALDEDARNELERAAHSCPVRLSLLAAIDVPVKFNW